jgi:RNA polymerase sigma-70 factor (ECF subfamily)
MLLLLEKRLEGQKFDQLNPAAVFVDDLFKQHFYTWFGHLYAYAFTIVKDNSEAKDIVQSAFIKLWEKREEVNLSSAGRAFLYTTVYRLALNTIRDRKTREKHHQQISLHPEAIELHFTEDKELQKRIAKAIDELPPRCKEVFTKSRFEGKKYVQIAEELNISLKTVEAQMGKALKYLREQLADLTIVWVFLLFI